MIFYKDKKYSFIELFNEENGFLLRSNIFADGVESDMPANRRAFPELIDIGIMGHCHAVKSGICRSAGVDCYQNALSRHRPNMLLNDYKKMLYQCKGKTFQVALGGAGDPNKHENFQEILEFTRMLNIVPNLTTSGYNLKDDEVKLIKKYCGAVAVSFYSRLDQSMEETNQHTLSATNTLVGAGCKVNVHYVLSNDSLDDAITRIQNGLFPKGINAVVFLLYKPVGNGKKEKVIDCSNKKYIEFIKNIHSVNTKFNIGFDTCQSSGLLYHSKGVSVETIDSCEAARFSMYIDSDLKGFPCSFGYNQKDYHIDLKETSIKDAWNSDQFEQFRIKQHTMCKSCDTDGCVGCALDIGLNLCGCLPLES